MTGLFASVIIYTYDRRKFILNALRSVVSQTLPREKYEIIVVKGYSDPEIDGHIDSLADQNIVINEKGHGKKLAPAIRKARGEVIFILDDDDELEPERLDTILQLFEKDVNLIFTHNPNTRIDDDGASLGKDEATPDRDIAISTSSLSRKNMSTLLRYRANWYSSCMAFKKSVLSEHLVELETVEQSVDPFLFFMVLASEGNIILLSKRLTRYRVHESTTNLSDEFSEFIDKKRMFYSNTIKTYKYALNSFKTERAMRVIGASIRHLELISLFLAEKPGRMKLLKGALSLISTFRILVTRYQVVWVLLSLLRFVIGNSALRLYYRYNLS